MHKAIARRAIRDVKTLEKEADEYKRECEKCGKKHKGKC